MSADTLAVILVALAAPPATLFPFVYATRPWYRSLLGRALMTKAIGIALLIDISLLYNWLGDDYALRDVVRLTVYSLITCGVWFQFIALVRTIRKRDD